MLHSHKIAILLANIIVHVVRTIGSVLKQPVAGSKDDVTTICLCHVIHLAHVTSWYRSLLLQVSVKDDDATAETATPELLLDDAYIVRHYSRQTSAGTFQPLVLIESA